MNKGARAVKSPLDRLEQPQGRAHGGCIRGVRCRFQQPEPALPQLLEQYRWMHREGDVRRGTPAEQTFDGKSLPGRRSASRS